MSRAAREEVGGLLKFAFEQERIGVRTIEEKTGIPASSLATVYAGTARDWEARTQRLVRLLSTIRPIPPDGLARLLVLLGMTTPWSTVTPPSLRFDTITIDLPRPTARNTNGLTAGKLEALLTEMTESKIRKPNDRRGFKWTWARLKPGLMVSPRQRDASQRAPRGIRVQTEPSYPNAQMWLRLQVCPFDPDHLRLLGLIRDLFGPLWSEAHVARLDFAYDFDEAVQDLVVLNPRARRYETRRAEGGGGPSLITSVAVGGRDAPTYCRLYTRDECREARCEVEVKPRGQRILLRDLADVACPLRADIEVVLLRDARLCPAEKALVVAAQEHGVRGALDGASRRMRAEFADVLARLRRDGAVFDVSGAVRDFWPHGSLYLHERILIGMTEMLPTPEPWPVAPPRRVKRR